MAGNRAAATRTHSHGMDGSRRDQYVILASIAAVAVAAVIVLVGLYITTYRPPRQHVLTAGTRSYNAGDVERRALYLLLYQQGSAPRTQEEIVPKTLELLEREEILRSRVPAAVGGELSPEAVAEELDRILMRPEVSVTTSTPGQTPTPTPTIDPDERTRALQERLSRSRLTKPELDAIVLAGLYEDKLREKLLAELPKTMPQVLLVTARLGDQATAEQVRSIGLRPGVDFARVAGQNSVPGADGTRTGSPEWVVVEQLDAPVRDAVQALRPGDISAVTRNGMYFEVYKVVEAEADRELSEEQRDRSADAKILEWFEAERQHVTIERDLSPDEEDWITEHAVADFSRATEASRAR